MLQQVPRQEYGKQQQQGYPPHYQQPEHYQQQQQTTHSFRDRKDYPGEYPQPRDTLDGRDHGKYAQPHRLPQQEQDPRIRGPNYYDGHDMVDYSRSDYNKGMVDKWPGHHDPRMNNSYDSRGDGSFESGSQGQPMRHSHYDDRSLPHQNNDRYRQMPNGGPQSAPPRHQSIPPAHQDHSNFTSISQSPAALQYERVSSLILLCMNK